MVKVCEICGDIGDALAIITCCECTSSRQHLYCMRVLMEEAPTFWKCDECEQSKLLSPTKTLRDHKPESCAPKRSNIGPKSPASRHSFKEARVDTGKTRYISCIEAVKLSSGSKNPPKNARMPPPHQRTPIKSPPHDPSQKSTSPREKVVQYFRNKGNATPSSIKPPARETKTVESPTPKKSTEFEPPVAKETVISPLHNRGDATSSLTSPKKTDLQKSAVQQSPGQKVNAVTGSKKGGDDAVLPVNRSPPSTGAKRKFTEENRSAKSVVVYSRKEAGMGNRVNSPKSTDELKETAKVVVASPRKELDIGKLNELPESSKKLEKPNTKSGADVEAGSSDPFIPTYTSCWTGDFIVPNGHEKFKAHLPSKVHHLVYKAVKDIKKEREFVFTLVPTQDLWMQLFPNYIPDTNDIGLYFFPVFKKRFENDVSIIDLLWREKMVMKSKVEGLELLVFSSRLLQPKSQEFQGIQFLWGVLRRPKHDDVAKTAALLLLDKNCEKCDAAPPGFKKICKCC